MFGFIFQFALLVGDSHLRAIVDGYSTMPKGDCSLGVLASPGASAEELRLEVLDAVLPRPPEVICLLAPSNNLTASRTFVEAGAAFDALLSTVCNLSANVSITSTAFIHDQIYQKTWRILILFLYLV